MKPAQPTDWNTKKLPAKRTTISLNRTFSLEEIQRIRMGLIPEQMEEKWFIYWQDNKLYFHRSWVGYCIYVVHFLAESDSYQMIAADVNRDPNTTAPFQLIFYARR